MYWDLPTGNSIPRPVDLFPLLLAQFSDIGDDGIRNRKRRYFQKINTWDFPDLNAVTTRQQLLDLADRVRFHTRPPWYDPDFTAISFLAEDWYTAGPQDVRYFV